LYGQYPVLVSAYPYLAAERSPVGDFSTTEIKRYWNLQVYPDRQTLGWGFGKLEVICQNQM